MASPGGDQVSRFPGGTFATWGNKALFQPGGLVMQVVVGSCLHHVLLLGGSTTIGVENCTVQQQTGQVESLGRVTWGDHNLGTTCGDHNTKVNQKVSAREIGRARIFLGKADIFNQQ